MDYTQSENLGFWKTSQQPTLSNTVDLPSGPSNGIEVLAAGDVKFTTVADSVDTRTIPAEWIPYLIRVQAKRVWATGTTVSAANLRVGA